MCQRRYKLIYQNKFKLTKYNINSCIQTSDGEINYALCAWAKQNGLESVVTDGVQKLSPAQSFQISQLKLKETKMLKCVCF